MPSLFSASDLPVAPAPDRSATRPRGGATAPTNSIADIAAAYGVASKADKSMENAEIAAAFQAQYPSDRLLPMPASPHPDWEPERVELVRELSERLVAISQDYRTANLWRANLARPRGRFSSPDAALRRVVDGYELRARVRAGLELGFRYRDSAEVMAPPMAEPPAPGKTRRRARIAAPVCGLAHLMRSGHCIVSVSWGNSHSSPPSGLPRTIWQLAVPSFDKDYAMAYAPDVIPGVGWVIGISFQQADGPRWSEEAKGRVRRRNLEKRLERKAPLFAKLWFAAEVAARPDYFAGKPYDGRSLPCREQDASQDTVQGVPTPPDISPASGMLGHNGGPQLDPV